MKTKLEMKEVLAKLAVQDPESGNSVAVTVHENLYLAMVLLGYIEEIPERAVTWTDWVSIGPHRLTTKGKQCGLKQAQRNVNVSAQENVRNR